MALITGLLCCGRCRRLAAFRQWLWARNEERGPGMRRSREALRKAKAKRGGFSLRRRRLRKSPELNTIHEQARVFCVVRHCNLCFTVNLASQEDESAIFAPADIEQPAIESENSTAPVLKAAIVAVTAESTQEPLPPAFPANNENIKPAEDPGAGSAEPKAAGASLSPHFAIAGEEVLACAVSTQQQAPSLTTSILQAFAAGSDHEDPSPKTPAKDPAPKDSDFEDAATCSKKPKPKSPLKPAVLRFNEEVITISPVSSSTNIAGEKDNPREDRSPQQGRVSTQPLSRSVPNTDLAGIDFDWEARRESIRARSLKTRIRRRLQHSPDRDNNNNNDAAAPMSSREVDEQAGAESLGSLKGIVSSLKKVGSIHSNNSTMSTKEHDEHEGDEPLTSFKGIVSSLKKVGSTHSNHSSKSESSETTLSIEDMPKDRPELEARLNIILGRLDRLRNQVRLFNSLIKEYYDLFESQRRIHATYPEVKVVLEEELENVRKMRTGFEKSLKALHRQIDRIATARARLDESEGQVCTIWDMYMGYKHEDEWADLFAY
ncbi:hypothetical protein A1O1_04789 [Capronia coronata CBS 617.96]|uniref:Uncharacterized protein n=1 Tax=Capronia coronata CBS 617.96 TaxID=1182541 RepID=W9Y501_9EURO|nr:uncharacterized protein A1O1_04789 [Capronia coronata CBS 617.96]EXJ87862.1 hypothetical protein A1O1_04789 [Capronia coronata CBS 617.96]